MSKTRIFYGTGINAGGIAGSGLNSFAVGSGVAWDNSVHTGTFKDPFTMSGSIIHQPIPYVSISEEMVHAGRKRGQNTSITLEGQLIGPDRPADFAELMSYEEQLMNNFHSQFEPLVIVDDGEIIFAAHYCKVNSINFDSSKHYGIVDYSIELSSHNYNQAVDSADQYVTDMEDSFSFNDNGDGTASMTHSISARGLNVANSSRNQPMYQSLVSAKNWVKSKRGWDKQVWPSWVPFESTPVLVGETQSEDALNGSFSLTEEYLYNTYKGKVSYGGGGNWAAIRDAIKNGNPVAATYSFVPGGMNIHAESCSPGAATLAADGVLQAGVATAFEKWKAVFEKAFPDAYDAGFRLNFVNNGAESENTIPIQGGGLYSLEAGSAAAAAGVGDFRMIKVGNQGGLAGCAEFPDAGAAAGWIGVSGAGGGDVIYADGAYNADGCGSAMEAAHLAFHEIGHALGFGHDRDDSDLTIMSYAQLSWQSGPLNHDDSKCVSLAAWYPDGVENHVQILNQVRGVYGAGGYADRPIITLKTSIDDNYPDEFSTVSATIHLKGGQRWTQDDLREYVKADKFWHPGVKGTTDGASLTSSAAAGNVWYNTDGTGPEYKSLFHLVASNSPNWIAPNLNTVPDSYSVDEANSDATAAHSSELTINVSYSTNTIFGNTADSFDNDAYFDYQVDINMDNISKISQASINGVIVARVPDSTNLAPAFIDSAKGKLASAQAFLNSITDLETYLYVKANEVHAATVGPCWTLNPKPESISVNKNPFNGEISISAEFSDKDWIKSDFLNGAIKNISWDMNVKAGLPHFERSQSYNINGLNLIYDIDIIKREMIDVTLKAEYNKNIGLRKGIDDVIGYMYSNYFLLKAPMGGAHGDGPALIDYKNPKILSENMSYDENEGTIELKAGWSQEGLGFNAYYPPAATIVIGKYVN